MACCSRACPYPAAALLCHLGPLLHFKSALGLPTAAGGRATQWQPTSVNALGGLLVGDGRVTAGVSELGPAMSDGESGLVPSEL